MKKSLIYCALILCLLLSLLPTGVLAVQQDSGTVEVRSAEELSEQLAESSARAMAVSPESTPSRVLVFANDLPDPCGAQRVLHYAPYREYVLVFPSVADAERAYTRLTEEYGLESCWLDTPEQAAHAFEGNAPSGSDAASTWGLEFMNLSAYQETVKARLHFDRAQVVVAIIDSGADPEAENLMRRSYESFDVVNGKAGTSEIASSNSTRGHGTRVASILDATLPESVRFMYLRVFDEGGEATRTDVSTAIQYAVEHGADVINMSLGWEDDIQQDFAFLDEALTAARKAGVTVVCAAGNNHQNIENCYPANSKHTIAVSGVSQSLKYEVYSNYGELVDFCAPGSGISAMTVGGSLVNCVGTSFAAPHITAAATQLKILEPDALPGRIYALLHLCAMDIGIPGKDIYNGWGIPVLPEDIADRISHDKSLPYMETIVTQEPTCTEEGSVSCRCTICGETAGAGETLPARGHSWGEWILTSPATAQTEGTETRTCSECGETETRSIPKLTSEPTQEPNKNPFTDVSQGKYYYDPVLWAVSHDPQITDGTSETTFSPDAVCTRGQVVTFLWRAAGCAEPRSTRDPFADVQESDYFYKAVLWAVENGITDGTSATAFSPNEPCTRAHVVTFLWRAEHQPNPGRSNPFRDVASGQYYYHAVLWAVSHGITDGTSESTFGPAESCTRGQIVTFLYRDMQA